MLKALNEQGIEPDLILGTSIGAFNGSVIADQPGDAGVKRLLDLWDEIAESGVFVGRLIDRIRNLATFQPGIHSTRELQIVLEHVHGTGKRIENLAIPFQCVAASIDSSRSPIMMSTGAPVVERSSKSSEQPA